MWGDRQNGASVRAGSGPLSLTRLTSTIGARVEGVDARREIPDEQKELIRHGLWEHGVLVFPGDGVGMDEQRRLVACFGTVQPLAIFRFLGEPNPALAVDPRSGGTVDRGGQARRKVTFNRQPEKIMEFQGWHTDSSFMPELPQAAALRAEVIPPVGGDTCFASLCAAYEALSPVMQDLLAGLRAVHAMPPGYKESIDVWQYGEDAEERFDEAFPPREHPVVIEHPESGRRSLFVNPSYTVRIAGMTDRESANVLRFLYDHISTPDFVYRHHWSDGDIVVWDELVCLHLAPRDYHPHERRLVRVTAGSAVPAAPRS